MGSKFIELTDTKIIGGNSHESLMNWILGEAQSGT